MPQLHQRTIPVRQAGGVLVTALIEWVEGRAERWSWEDCVLVMLDIERRCLHESLGYSDRGLYVFQSSHAVDVWERIVLPWKNGHCVTWLEAARIIHQDLSSWLNYALRGERHPDDPTGEKKADEA